MCFQNLLGDGLTGAEKKIKDMIKKAKKSNVDEVYIATDPDREGEFIAWRLSIIFADFDSAKESNIQ